MSPVTLAIGIGCRKGCAAPAIVDLVTRARTVAQASAGGVETLFTIEDKRDEPGLRAAAALLRLDIAFLSRAALLGVMPGVVTRSAASEARFGVASVSEAAALAGAGPGAVLLVPRMAAGGVTCAIAHLPSEAS